MGISKPAEIKPISLSVEEREKWVQIIYDFFADSGTKTKACQEFILSTEGQSFQNPLLEFCKRAVSQCEAGWPKASNSITSRISQKTGWNSQLRKAKIKIKQEKNYVRTEAPAQKHTGIDIVSILTNEERDFFERRRKEYIEDFEFNTSSDLPNVERLIVDEIMYKRLTVMQLEAITTGKTKNQNVPIHVLNNLVEDTHKRINELQKQLGISRLQRADALNSSHKSIAEMAAELDEKLRNDASLIEKLREEEMLFTKQKQMEEPINVVPEKHQLEQILKSDNGTIYEQTAKYILAKTAPDISKKEEGKPNLPDGVSL